MPRGWEVIEDKEILVKDFGMPKDIADATSFMLYRSDTMGYIVVTCDPNKYPTLWEYYDALQDDIQGFNKNNARVVNSAKGITETGHPVYKVVISDQSLAYYYIYYNGCLFRFMSNIKQVNDKDEKIVADVILSIRKPTEIDFLQETSNKVYQEGRFADNIKILNEILLLQMESLGEEHPNVAFTYLNIAVSHKRIEEYVQAIENAKKGLQISENSLGVEHQSTATHYHELASIYAHQKNFDSAIELLKRASEIREKALGLENGSTINSLFCLGLAYYEKNDYEAALGVYSRILEISERTFGKEHGDTAIAHVNVGKTHKALNDYAKALERYHCALEVFEKAPKAFVRNTIDLYEKIADVYSAMGNCTESLGWLQKALAICEEWFGIEHTITEEMRQKITRASE